MSALRKLPEPRRPDPQRRERRLQAMLAAQPERKAHSAAPAVAPPATLTRPAL